MTTDFSYGGKQIVSGGPFKPGGEDMPSDARTRVNCYADIASIPNPYVGLKITVKVDETNNNKMTDYIVKSLKANSIGLANSLIDEVVRYVDYLGVNTSGSLGEGLTSEQAQQLQTAYEHSQSTHVTSDDLLNIDAVSLNGKKFSGPMAKNEYDAIANKEPNTIYLVDDDATITGVPDYSTNDAGKVLAVNSTGTALEYINLSTGSGLTTEQVVNISKIPSMEANILSNTSAINNRYTKEEVNEIISNISIESGNIKIRDVVNGESFIMGLPIYGDIIVSSENISAEENATTKFTVKLSKKPTNNQIITLSVSNSECSIDKTSLTFTPTNYNQLQEINITCNHDTNSYRDKNSIITLSSLNVDSVTVNVTITNIDEQVFAELVPGAVSDQTNIKGTVNISSTYGFSPEVITNMVNKETSSLDRGSSFTIFAKVGFEQKTGSENPTVRILVIQDVDNNNIKSAVFERTWKGELHWSFYNTKDQQYPQNYDGQITYENGVDMYITFVYDSATKKMYIYKDTEVISQKVLTALNGFNSENNDAVIIASEISPIRRILIYSKALTKEEVLQNINALGGI